MNNFELLCSMGAETDVLVHWIKSRRPKGELKVPPEVYCALLKEAETLTRPDFDMPAFIMYGECKITIADKMDFV